MMNKIILFTALVSILSFSCKQNSADSISNDEEMNAEKISKNYPEIAKLEKPVTLDGQPNDEAWEKAKWLMIDEVWMGGELEKTDFRGRYKLLWDEDFIYILAETQDDVLRDTHKDGLDRYWDDDCLELFIDEDNSDGDHQYNHNAFAYHISTDLRTTDIGTDSLPAYFDNHLQAAKSTANITSIWEVKMSVYPDDYTSRSKPRKLKEGEEIGFMVAYCDNDNSPEREHFIGSNKIEGEDKNRGWIDAGVFNNWVLGK